MPKLSQNQTTICFSTQRIPSLGCSGVMRLICTGAPQKGSILMEYLLWNYFSLRFTTLYKFLFKKTPGRNSSLKSVAEMVILSHIVTGLSLASECWDLCQNQAQDPHQVHRVSHWDFRCRTVSHFPTDVISHLTVFILLYLFESCFWNKTDNYMSTVFGCV